MPNFGLPEGAINLLRNDSRSLTLNTDEVIQLTTPGGSLRLEARAAANSRFTLRATEI